MAIKSRAQIISDADTNIADNHIGDITAADIRNAIKDLADSSLFPSDAVNASTLQGYDSDHFIANTGTITTQTVNVGTALNISVSNFKMTGGSATAKFLVTNGTGTNSYYYPQLSDLSDFATYSSGVSTSIEQTDNNALAYAIALG